MRFTGEHWWGDSSKAEEDKILNAIFRKKEVVIDYEFRGRVEWLKINTKDGIYFSGAFGRKNKQIGTCEFNLYKNTKEWLLFGGGNSIEEGDFSWFIKLRPQVKKIKKERIKN